MSLQNPSEPATRRRVKTTLAASESPQLVPTAVASFVNGRLNLTTTRSAAAPAVISRRVAGARRPNAQPETKATPVPSTAPKTPRSHVTVNDKGMMSVNTPDGVTIGAAFYDRHGELELVLDRNAGYIGPVMVYDRTPEFAADRAPRYNLRDASPSGKWVFRGFLQHTAKGRAWFGEIETRSFDTSRAGHPR